MLLGKENKMNEEGTMRKKKGKGKWGKIGEFVGKSLYLQQKQYYWEKKTKGMKKER